MQPLTPEEMADAQRVLSELLRLEAELDDLSDESDPRTLKRSAVPALKERLAAIKADIKLAAKYETVSRTKSEKTDFEQSFFGPAVRSASANFRMPINANPFTQSWVSGLNDSRGDISHFRFGLEKHIKERTQ